MYVFTDAGPKDASDEFIEEVKYLASAEEYGVTINFFTTGKKCNNRFVSKIVHKIIIAFSGTKKANVLCYARRWSRSLCCVLLTRMHQRDLFQRIALFDV